VQLVGSRNFPDTSDHNRTLSPPAAAEAAWLRGVLTLQCIFLSKISLRIHFKSNEAKFEMRAHDGFLPGACGSDRLSYSSIGVYTFCVRGNVDEIVGVLAS
jgi:hypothetical protein